MQIKIESTINAPADTVWELLGPRFGEIHQWSSLVELSRATGAAQNGAPCDGRVCETPLGKLDEKILLYDADARRVAYSARGESMPSFVKDMRNNWAVESMGKSQSRVINTLQVDIAFPFNLFMGFMMKLQMTGYVKTTHEELKYTAETGRAHPRLETAQAV